jgi:hypothetical protein
MFVTAAGNTLCLQVLFFATRKTSHWWTCLLSTACSNIRSATLQYIELDTQVVSSAASVGCTIISGHTYVRDIQSEPTGWDTVMVKIDTSNVQLFMVLDCFQYPSSGCVDVTCAQSIDLHLNIDQQPRSGASTLETQVC